MAISRTRAEKTLSEVVLDSWNIADRQRAPRVAVWDESYKEHDPSYIDKERVKRAPFVKYPYLHRVTTTQTTIVMDTTEAAPRIVMAQPMSPGPFQRERSEMATELCEVQFRQKSPDYTTNNIRTLRRVVNMGLKYGNSYLEPEWIRTKRWWGIRLRGHSPYDVWEDARHGRYRWVRRVVTLAELREIALGISQPIDGATGELRDGGRALDTFRAIARAVESGVRPCAYVSTENGPYDTDRRFQTGRVAGGGSTPGHPDSPDEYVRPEDDPYNQPIVIIERHEVCEDGMIVRIIPDPNDTYRPLLLQAEENPYGACQVVPFVPYFVDNEFYGIGNYEIAGLIARGLSYNFRGALAAIGAQAWPPVLKTRRANIRDSHISSLYGRVIDVDQPTDLTYMAPSIGPSFHQIGMAISQQAADVGTGEGDLRRGDVGAARNATSAAIAETFATLTDKNIFQQWSDTLTQVGHLMLELARIHLPGTEAIPILGRDTAAFVEVKPDLLEGPWHVIFGGSTRGSSQQQIALWGQTLTMFGQSGELDIRECAREVIRLQGQRDVQRFLSRKDETPDFQPEAEEEALLRFGRMPEVSPRNDHRMHWQRHMATYQTLASTLGPQHPHVQKLGIHLVATEQAAMAMAGVGMGSVQPFQPQQAGEPGQPAAFTPSTAAVNADRQASNAASPGQPPGPAGVPERQTGRIETGGRAR